MTIVLSADRILLPVSAVATTVATDFLRWLAMVSALFNI